MTTQEANEAIEIFEEIQAQNRNIENLRVKLYRITDKLNESDLSYFNYNTKEKYEE
jgi:hypothetical protein